MKVSRTLLIAAVLLSVIPASLTGATPSETGTLTEVWGFASASAPGGQMWMVWSAKSGHDTDIWYSRGDGQAWSSPRRVHASPDEWDDIPTLALGVDGKPWAAWAVYSGESSKLYVSRWTGSRWTQPETVPVASQSDVKQPVLATAPDGTLWLAWAGSDGIDDEIYASRWDGRSWSPALQVNSDDDDPKLWDRQPRLAVGQDGRPWLVWTGHQSGVDDEICFSRWTGTAWTPEQMISEDDEGVDLWPSLVLDGQDQPWVAWKASLEQDGAPRLRILFSRWDASSNRWTAEALASSPLAAEVDEERPALSVDENGQIHLAWVVYSASDTSLAYARWLGDRWGEARLVQAGVRTHAVGLVTPTKRAPTLLWVDLEQDVPSLVGTATVDDTARPLSTWVEAQTPSFEPMYIPSIPNSFLAFGDSITWGQYYSGSFYPYPSFLEDKLDTRVMESDVHNVGVPSEFIKQGSERIKGEVQTYLPKYVLAMEGTNNVSHDAEPSEMIQWYMIMIDNTRPDHSGVKPVKFLMGTLIPRTDSRYNKTREMNQDAVIWAANEKGVPICDLWQAFHDYGPWEDLFCWSESDPDHCPDDVHPNEEGLQLMADTWYDCLVGPGMFLNEETIAPSAWIVSGTPPAQSPCGQVNVGWTGTDNLTPVWELEYDVQMNVNGGGFSDLVLDTKSTGTSFVYETYGDTLGFRVRARDLVGNESLYSSPAYTTITDSVDPEGYIQDLVPAQLAPIPVRWGGRDACSGVDHYDVQYKVGTAGTWTDWKMGTTDTSGTFTPVPAVYGETYYFRAMVYDRADNWDGPFETSTTLARYSAEGEIFDVRHQPVAGADVELAPVPLWLRPQPAGFVAYTAESEVYDITAWRDDLYGPLPDMQDVSVDQNISGLGFILPPQDDAVEDGDFEAGDLAAWQVGGTAPPTLSPVAHTGDGAVSLDGSLSEARLSQVITPQLGISDPTLSFLVCLGAKGPTSTLQIELANSTTFSPAVAYTLEVSTTDWTHVWYDLTGVDSEPLTLTLVVADSPAVIVDEVRLGSAPASGHWLYLPFIQRGW